MLTNLNTTAMGKTFGLFLVTCLLSGSLLAQVFVEQGPIGTSRDGMLKVYGMNGMNPRIPYYKIRGSAFFNPEWLKAELYQPDGKPMGIYPVRLNLATHEVHFLDKKGYELAANDGVVARVVFVDSLGDGKPKVSFRNDYDAVNLTYNGNKKYAQEMNPGDLSLLKVTIRDGREADSMFGTLKRYYFTDRFDYYVRIYKRVEKIRKLNQDEIFAVIPAKRETVDYVKRSKLNLKKEEDVIALFDYLNSQPKDSPKQ
jgi:hypothetical protein